VDAWKEVDGILSVEVQPSRCSRGRRLEVHRDSRKAQSYLHAAGWKSELQSHEADSDPGLFLEVERLMRHATKSGQAVRQERVPTKHEEKRPLFERWRWLPLVQSEAIDPVLFDPCQSRPCAKRNRPMRSPQGDIRDRQISRLKQKLAARRSGLSRNRTRSGIQGREPERDRGGAFGQRGVESLTRNWRPQGGAAIGHQELIHGQRRVGRPKTRRWRRPATSRCRS